MSGKNVGKSVSRRRRRHWGMMFALCKYNCWHHRYCTEPECRIASRRASRLKWIKKNLDYFLGAWNVERVRNNRLISWIRDRIARPLQDVVISKALEVSEFMPDLATRVQRGPIESLHGPFDIGGEAAHAHPP